VPPHRQRRQLQARNPALRALFERLDLGGAQIQAHDLVEQDRGFIARKAQIGEANLGHFLPCPHSGQRDGRVFAGGHRQMKIRRLIIEQEGHGLMNRAGLYQMIIIQHQHDRLGDGSDLVDQTCQNGVQWRLLCGLQRAQRLNP